MNDGWILMGMTRQTSQLTLDSTGPIMSGNVPNVFFNVIVLMLAVGP